MTSGSGSDDCGCPVTEGTCQCDKTGAASTPTMPVLESGWTLADLDSDWERDASEVLADVDFDTDLGIAISRDALRVSRGEMTKAAFHEKYQDAIIDEFGVDERPTKEAFETARESNEHGRRFPRIPSVDGPTAESRRTVLKALGGITVAGATAGMAGFLKPTSPAASSSSPREAAAVTDSNSNPADNPDVQMGMAVDTDACIACLQCSLACKEENNTDQGVHWPYVFRYEDEKHGDTREGELTRHCQHCTHASCTFVCPTQARYKRRDDGIVLTDYDTCIGCRYCQVACPYGVNYLGQANPTDLSDGFEHDRVGRDGRTVAGPPPKGVMGKCTFCVHRQDSGDPELEGTTACEQRCPVDAIHFGDMNDPESDPRQYLRGEFDNRESVADKNQFELLGEVGNAPNIVFVGREPSHRARPIQGPVAYEDHGMVDGAYRYEEEGES